MQLISWQMARLGSRFSLLFEPYYRRVMHSALGRLLDEPLDLMVGLVEPDGTERTLPFGKRGEPFHRPEQFERINSITYRGYSLAYHLRFEFNIHSVFYPQDEDLCLMPAFYLEMRVNPADNVRAAQSADVRPSSVRLLLRVARPQTQIHAQSTDGVGQIDLTYSNTTIARSATADAQPPTTAHASASVNVAERIVSLNRGAVVEDDGNGMTLELPVTEVGSGAKWRLVWGAYCGDNVLPAATGEGTDVGRFRYTDHLHSLDEVIGDAIEHRDDRLTRSRRFERVLEQAPLRRAQRHLVHQGFQNFLSNTFWCRQAKGKRGQATSSGEEGGLAPFSVEDAGKTSQSPGLSEAPIDR